MITCGYNDTHWPSTCLLPLVGGAGGGGRRHLRCLLHLLLLPLVTLSLTGTLTSALDDHAGTGAAVVVVWGGVPGLGGWLVVVPPGMPLAEHHLLVVVPLARGRRRPGGHLAHPEVDLEVSLS